MQKRGEKKPSKTPSPVKGGSEPGQKGRGWLPERGREGIVRQGNVKNEPKKGDIKDSIQPTGRMLRKGEGFISEITE